MSADVLVRRRRRSSVEVKIGVRQVTRELVLESEQTPEAVAALVNEAVKSADGVLSLTDEKGRLVVVPVSSLAYVEIAASTQRRVGFGA
jgi:dUTPase